MVRFRESPGVILPPPPSSPISKSNSFGSIGAFSVDSEATPSGAKIRKPTQRRSLQFAPFTDTSNTATSTNDTINEENESRASQAGGAPASPSVAESAKSKRSIAKHLRANLMRTYEDRDPLFYYEIVSVLGVGSMGSVAKVRKHVHVRGGSARKEIADHFSRERKFKQCVQIPVLGPLLKACFQPLWNHLQNNDSAFRATHPTLDDESQDGSTNSSILYPHAVAAEHNHDIQASINVTSPRKSGNSNSSLKSASSMFTKTKRNRRKAPLFAMKSIHLSRVTDPTFVDELKNEIHILKKLDHPHIVRPMEMFTFQNQIFIVMELCCGGDLYSRDPYTEAEAARIVSTLLSAVSFMHSKNIAHRDLKYENILFVNTLPQAEVKLIDFGLSKRYGKDGIEDMTEGVGTVYTMAPEVLRGSYTKEADIWSIGVIAFMLLSSQMPFYGHKRKQIVEQILDGRFQFKGRRWKSVSAQAKAFVSDLLVVNVEDRASAEEALSMTWLNRRFAETVRNANVAEEAEVQKSILRYSKYSKLKRMALMVMAHKSSVEEIGILRKVFQKYDAARVGHFEIDDFHSLMHGTNLTEEQLQHAFDQVVRVLCSAASGFAHIAELDCPRLSLMPVLE
jgi:calcium-dependent protein kinase